MDGIEGSKIRPGILSLLDDECKMGKTEDIKYLQSLFNAMLKTVNEKIFAKPRFNKNSFIVFHFAGSVEYVVDGFISKNSNQITPQIGGLVEAVKEKFLNPMLKQPLPPTVGDFISASPNK